MVKIWGSGYTAALVAAFGPRLTTAVVHALGPELVSPFRTVHDEQYTLIRDILQQHITGIT
jgi:hypothetical protein